MSVWTNKGVPVFRGWLTFLLLCLLAGTAFSATGMENDPLNCFKARLLAAIGKSLPGVEELSLRDNRELDQWLRKNCTAGQKVTVSQVGRWNRKNGMVPVQLEIDDGSGRQVRRWFKVEVTGKRRVLLAARDLRRGDPVRSGDFVSRLVDCRELRHEAVSRIPADMIFQLTCNLRAGEVVPASRLKPYRLIRRGELVRVVLEQGGIRISTRGVAMGNGALRDVITVKNPSSNKLYQARVTGSGEVVVVY